MHYLACACTLRGVVGCERIISDSGSPHRKRFTVVSRLDLECSKLVMQCKCGYCMSKHFVIAINICSSTVRYKQNFVISRIISIELPYSNLRKEHEHWTVPFDRSFFRQRCYVWYRPTILLSHKINDKTCLSCNLPSVHPPPVETADFLQSSAMFIQCHCMKHTDLRRNEFHRGGLLILNSVKRIWESECQISRAPPLESAKLPSLVAFFMGTELSSSSLNGKRQHLRRTSTETNCSDEQPKLYKDPTLRARVPWAVLEGGNVGPFRKSYLTRIFRRLRPRPQ